MTDPTASQMTAPDSPASEKLVVANQRPLALFPTGAGQYYTHAIGATDGIGSKNPLAGTEYDTISARELAAMVSVPQGVPKSSARWFIPSTYHASDARDHAVQRECGSFWWLCVDVDGGNLALGDMRDALAVVAPGASRLIYATRSSTTAARRWRALLPLRQPVPGLDYTDTALAFFALLQEASGAALIPDRKLALTGQLIFLPNRGDHYEHEVFRGATLDLTQDHPVIRRRETERTVAEAARQEATERRARKAAERPMVADGHTPVDRFNAAHNVADLLDRYGYLRLGQTDSWQSPYQTSGTFATRDFGDYWVSLSGSDAATELGSASSTGARFGDSFDLYVAFEHGGNFDAAVRAYGEVCDQQDLSGRLARISNTRTRSTTPEAIDPHESQTDQSSASDAVPGTEDPPATGTANLRLPTQFRWVEPSLIPPRPWLYGRHLLRQQVSVTVAPGGVGKSSNSIVEALAMSTGTPIAGEWVQGKLRTWIYNLEDPSDELQRRVTAAMIHHNVRPDALGGRLFIDSGRDRPLCTAMQMRTGTVINVPELDAMCAVIKQRGIDVLIVDPFVSSHQVNENDNGAIDLVAKQYWAVLAQRCNCAVELVHHTRKLGGEEGTSESARGASALLGAARSGRVLNKMSAEDRERAGIGAADSSVHFALVRDKANMAPPGKREWRRVVSVDLGNGDSVGVVEKWDWPDDFANLSGADLFKVQQAIDASPEPLRFSDQSSPWVGEIIAATLGLGTHSDKKRIKRMIETWLKTGALKKCVVKDDGRRDRPCIEVGDWAK